MESLGIFISFFLLSYSTMELIETKKLKWLIPLGLSIGNLALIIFNLADLQ